MSETRFLTFRRSGGGLYPVDDAGAKVVARVAEGGFMAVKLSQPRSLGHHRKFYKLMDIVFENQSVYPSKDVFMAAIKIAVGHCDIVIAHHDGKAIYVPKSLAFESLDQVAFEDFYDRVVKMICERFLPGVKRADLERQILELVG